jgi:hypothetical protein
MGAHLIAPPLMAMTIHAMKTFEAAICDGTPHGQVIIMGERRAWLAIGTGAAERTYRLVCQEGRHLLYVATKLRLPSLAKAVGLNENELIDQICGQFRAQAEKVLVLPQPWRWAISREFFGDRRILLRSRLTIQPVTAASANRAEACAEA